MLKVNSVSDIDLKTISFSTVTVKDFSSFVDNTSDDYFSLNKRYLDKLYKSIDLVGYQFIKNLYNIDSVYCVNLITRRIDLTSFNVYKLQGNETVLTSKQCIESYQAILNFLKENIETLFDVSYVSFNPDKCNQEFLVISSANQSGLYVSIDFINELIYSYKVNLMNDHYLVFDLTGSFQLADVDTISYIKDEIVSSVNNSIKNELPRITLTWHEVKKLCRLYKLDKTQFIEPYVETTLKAKSIDQRVNASSVFTLDFAKSLYANIDKVSNFYYFYNMILNKDFYLARD